ncbi:MAG TPA: bifunctional 3-(3-hydroxy-phenyl)propionate/3-hydroxycinnamic acid hydroxylase [Burkholderiaceae bacterium]|nr:bifunctional 3-(3-hydroxy-phenyl)propionate/3-hydroxycinnamic acid hydroxylase [Burkholderiaceae bacterium]
MEHSTYDVLIVGYGPTGATLANLLGLRGFTVAVFDQAQHIYDKPRAITADHEVMRVFQECGLSDEISAATRAHPGTDYIGLKNQVIKRFYPAPPPHPLSWDPTWMFVQPELEATLRRGAERFETVRTFPGHRLVRFTEDDGGVTLQVEAVATGESVEVLGRYLIGCDGGRSTVRRLLDGTIEDLAFDEWWIVVDGLLRGDIDLPKRATQYCHPWRPGSFIIGPGDLRRWEIKVLPGETPESFESHEAVRSVLSHFVDTTKIDLVRTAIYRFHALVVDEWKRGQVFLMGDAAHQTPPFLGQGLCAGIRDAANLAWKLEGVERKGYDRRLLDTYTAERKPHVRKVVEHAKEFGLIIGELDLDAAEERDRLLGEQLASGKAEIIRQKYIPGLEAGVIGRRQDGGPAWGAGDILVQPWVRSDESYVRLDDLIGPSFSLVVSSPDARSWPDRGSRDDLRRLGCRIVVIGDAMPAGEPDVLHVQERDGLAAAWFRQWGARAALVRPDHYVFGCADDPATLNQLIAQLAGAVLDGRMEPGGSPGRAKLRG